MIKKTFKFYKKTTVILLLIFCFLYGCQTTIPITYTEPARLNMSRVNRVAIDSNNTDVGNTVFQRLTATGKFTVATAAELAEWKRWRIERQTIEQLANYQARAIETSAADLVGVYAANAVRADASYKGRLLKITAVINEIQQSSRGRYFVRLVGAGNDSVVVYFASNEETSRIAAVDKGQTITIIGECVGRNLPDMEDTAEILRLLGAGSTVNIVNATFPVEGLRDYPGTVDAVIFLNTVSSVQDVSHVEERSRVVNNRAIKYNATIYDRSATVSITYQIVRTRDGSLIGDGVKTGTSSQYHNEDRSQLPDTATLVARTIERPLAEFIREIVPTQRSIYITLVKESENKNAKKEMGTAENLVKEGKYAEAATEYGKVYTSYRNFAAGYNQAVLTEAAEGTEAAISLMEALFKETGNPLAETTLSEMRRRNAANQQAANQLSQ